MLLLLAACGDRSTLSPGADVGSDPILVSPVKTLVPTVDIAPARGWPPGGKPLAAAGLAVNAYASGLDHPRWLHVLPNGDVLVAESNAPRQPRTSSTATAPIATTTPSERASSRSSGSR